MKNKLFLMIGFTMFSFFCVAQPSASQQLIQKAVSFAEENLNMMGTIKGETLPIQFIENIYLIKIYNINISHPAFKIIPIDESGTIIQNLTVEKFNSLSFVENVTCVDKALLYLILNNTENTKIIIDYENTEALNTNNKLLQIVIKIHQEYNKHAQLIPIIRGKYNGRYKGIAGIDNKRKTIIFIPLLVKSKDSSYKIRENKFYFRNGILVKVK